MFKLAAIALASVCAFSQGLVYPLNNRCVSLPVGGQYGIQAGSFGGNAGVYGGQSGVYGGQTGAYGGQSGSFGGVSSYNTGYGSASGFNGINSGVNTGFGGNLGGRLSPNDIQQVENIRVVNAIDRTLGGTVAGQNLLNEVGMIQNQGSAQMSGFNGRCSASVGFPVYGNNRLS